MNSNYNTRPTPLKSGHTTQGFSVLELVVSIGLLAVVVLAIIVQIDPIERAKEKRDTRLKSDVEMVQAGINEFYKEESRMPWADDFGSEDAAPALPWIRINKQEIGICADGACTKPGEVVIKGKISGTYAKSDLATGPDEDSLYIGKGKGAGDRVYVCYLPTSRKERENFGELFLVDFEYNITSRGTPPRCSSEVSWKNNDICYICVGN
ncbi:MAG: hypothetical protein Q7S79_04135 [bacterium]|nr:hypothetical protein [bacterium]